MGVRRESGETQRGASYPNVQRLSEVLREIRDGIREMKERLEKIEHARMQAASPKVPEAF